MKKRNRSAYMREYQQRPAVRVKRSAAEKLRDRTAWRQEYQQRPEALASKRRRAARPEYKASQRAWRRRPEVEARAWQLRGLPLPTHPRTAVCEICQNPPTARWRLALDHDHKTGKFRGWLCHLCNTALGKFHDSPGLLDSAMKYLRTRA